MSKGLINECCGLPESQCKCNAGYPLVSRQNDKEQAEKIDYSTYNELYSLMECGRVPTKLELDIFLRGLGPRLPPQTEELQKVVECQGCGWVGKISDTEDKYNPKAQTKLWHCPQCQSTELHYTKKEPIQPELTSVKEAVRKERERIKALLLDLGRGIICQDNDNACPSCKRIWRALKGEVNE